MDGEVKFSYSARYSKLGNLSNQTKQLWFVLHGYGQLAQYFINKFQVLHDMGHCVIAPEGLNRFYSKGFSGRVGATWMTKEDRLRDIENYIEYLNSVYLNEVKDKPTYQINILGFSQGAATASRWITQSNIHFDLLILWAGIFPADMEIEQAHNKLRGKKIVLAVGSNDPYVSKERLNEQHQLVSRLKLSPKVITYDGTHEIDNHTLRKIAESE